VLSFRAPEMHRRQSSPKCWAELCANRRQHRAGQWQFTGWFLPNDGPHVHNPPVMYRLPTCWKESDRSLGPSAVVR